MNKIIFVLGPDDHNSSRIKESKNNELSLKAVGTMPLYSSIIEQSAIRENSCLLVLGVHKELNVNAHPSYTKLINLVGDPDSSVKSLNYIEKMSEEIKFAKVINHPSKIYKTSRALLPKVIGDIENVLIAKTTYVKPENIDELIAAINANGFSYPLIVRLAGFHNSSYMQKINSELELSEIEHWFSTDRDFIILEYINCSHPDGYYRKFRIAVIDGVFFPQHLLSSSTWCVDAGNRYNLMIDVPALRQEEKDYLNNFNKVILPKYEVTLKEIHNKIGLDIYGIDCFLRDDGTIVVFEANACMDLISMWLGPNNEYKYKKPHRAAVRKAIINLLIK